MDPDANLEEQLSLAKSLVDGDGAHGVPPGGAEDDAARLAELVLALHEWIQKGGAMPEAWER